MAALTCRSGEELPWPELMSAAEDCSTADIADEREQLEEARGGKSRDRSCRITCEIASTDQLDVRTPSCP